MIVLPMAGLFSRFFKAGYLMMKCMLGLHGALVFVHALGSFARLFGQERFVVICRNIAGTSDLVHVLAAALGLDAGRLDLMVLKRETAGQAETATVGLRAAGALSTTAVTIFNIDTFRPSLAHPASFDIAAVYGYLKVFTAPGEHWSFAKPHAGTDRVEKMTEKRRISDLCSGVLYYFHSAATCLELLSEVENSDPASRQGGEYYVAPLYNADIRNVVVPTAQNRSCGTPDEYTALCAQPPFPPVGVGP